MEKVRVDINSHPYGEPRWAYVPKGKEDAVNKIVRELRDLDSHLYCLYEDCGALDDPSWMKNLGEFELAEIKTTEKNINKLEKALKKIIEEGEK